MDLPALADGVRLGSAVNPVVVIPGRPSVIVDETTLGLLRRIAEGETVSLADDADTVHSVAVLVGAGILTGSNMDLDGAGPLPYKQSLADLSVRKPVRSLSWVVKMLGCWLKPASTVVGVSFGVALLLLVGGSVLMFLPVDSTLQGLVMSPGMTVLSLACLQFLRTLIHEAGHYSVLASRGLDSEVGVGLYWFGPVLFVDMSPLDAESRRVRLLGDLAGPAIDGWILSLLCLWHFTLPTPASGTLLITTAAIALSNLRPTEKYDGYWALRDAFEARMMLATWATPRALVQSALHASGRIRRFAIALVCLYSAAVLWASIAGVRWLIGGYHLVRSHPMTMVIPIFGVGIYLTVYVVSKRLMQADVTVSDLWK